MSNLHLILGDQLSHSISSLKDYNPSKDIILMCELLHEATYVKHHKKKIAFLFSAMRHFARELKEKRFIIEYTKIDDEGNTGTFKGEVGRMLQNHCFQRIIVTHPGEYRVLLDIQQWQQMKSNFETELFCKLF